jgi:hypothetical protein
MAPAKEAFTPYPITEHRANFLRAVRRIPEARAVFQQLATEASGLSSAHLKLVIEKWAIEWHLAEPPVEHCWIYDVVASWLRRLASAPPSLDDEANEDECRKALSNHYLYVPVVYASVPKELPFRLFAFDPKCETIDEYRSQAHEDLEEYLDSYTAALKGKHIPTTRETKHYEWLVRYQILGESYDSMCVASGTEGYRVTRGTIKTAVLDLHALVTLPTRRKPGRFRKR